MEFLTLVVATIGMAFAILGGVSSWYNTFVIQRPWRDDDLRDRESRYMPGDESQSVGSLPEGFIYEGPKRNEGDR